MYSYYQHVNIVSSGDQLLRISNVDLAIVGLKHYRTIYCIYVQVFGLLDMNKDGSIDEQEFTAGMKLFRCQNIYFLCNRSMLSLK